MTSSTSSHPSPSLLTSLQATLGEELVQEIQGCKLLLVGAGGIGCELLKNLALSGFTQVTVVDLDTIDVSNLNRQLLFRSQHVGHAKCTTAAQVATQLAEQLPDNNNDKSTVLQYTALHGNVCDSSTFHVRFVQQFDLVINALDNLQARRRVNRLCLAATVPLVEAGTTGYLGQSNVISKGEVACYECNTVETPKVYPICTIRATPSQPVHTIVWAKEFYKLLYSTVGANGKESMLFEDVATLEEETSTYMDTVEQVRAILHAKNDDKTENKNGDRGEEQLPKLIITLIQNLYHDEIVKQLGLERYKTALKTPQPLKDMGGDDDQKMKAAPTRQASFRTTDVACWTPAGCAAELVAVIGESIQSSSSSFPEAFDKDHDGAMRFVTAASNLRNIVFGIEPIQSIYSAKGIAGNIIPAIATTNAIAAGLQILQVYRVLSVALHKKNKKNKGEASATMKENGTKKEAPAAAQNKEAEEEFSIATHCRYNNILRQATRNGLVITASKLQAPNPHCFVCRQGTVELSCNTHVWTLQHLLSRVLKQELGLQEPSVNIGPQNCDLIWEQGEDSDEAMFRVNLPKVLSKLPAGGIQHGTIVRVDDFTQALELSIHVSHQQEFGSSADAGDKAKEEENGGSTTEEFPFVLKGGSSAAAAAAAAKPPPAAAAAASTNGDNNKKDNDDDDDDDDEIVVMTNNKRKKDPNGEDDEDTKEVGTGDRPSKRQKQDGKSPPPPSNQQQQQQDVIMIDDD